MIIHVTLYGLLRDKLPRKSRGKADVELPDGSSLADLKASLGIESHAVGSVNGEVERNPERILQHGDRVNIFRAAGGG